MRDWHRLAERVRERRLALDLSQPGLAAAAGFAVTTVSMIERAQRQGYEFLTLSKLERALGWSTGSVEAVLDGGEPTMLSQDQFDDGSKVPLAYRHAFRRAAKASDTVRAAAWQAAAGAAEAVLNALDV